MQEHEDVELQVAPQEHDVSKAIKPPRHEDIMAMARADLKYESNVSKSNKSIDASV